MGRDEFRLREGSTVELTGDQHVRDGPAFESGVPIIGLHLSLDAYEGPLPQGSARVGIKEAAGLLVKAADVVKLNKVGRR